MRILTLILFLLSHNLFAQKNSRIGELKGIDFKFGATTFDLSSNDARQIFSDIVLPDLERNGIKVTEFIDANALNYSGTAYLGVATKNKWFPESKILKNAENRFGIVYNRHRSNYITCKTAFPTDTAYGIDGMIRYDAYGINADYTINSRPFLKDFAVYLSLGGAVFLHNYRANKFGGPGFGKQEVTIRGIEITSKFSITSLDMNMVFGYKYNLSCDFNLFMELSMGGSYYHKGLYGDNKLLFTGNVSFIGIRYKFIKPEDKTKAKINLFW